MLQIWIKDVSGWPNMTCLAFYIFPPKLGFNVCWSIYFYFFFWPRSQKNPLSFQGDEELPGGERCLLLLPHGEHPEVQEEPLWALMREPGSPGEKNLGPYEANLGSMSTGLGKQPRTSQLSCPPTGRRTRRPNCWKHLPETQCRFLQLWLVYKASSAACASALQVRLLLM